MRFSRPGSSYWQCAHRSLCALVLSLAASLLPSASAEGGNPGWRTVSVSEYREHLEDLDRLAANCQKQHNANVCDATHVGPDDRVQLTVNGRSQQREVRYAWLRDLLDSASASGKRQTTATNIGTAQITKERPPSVDELLTQAHQRLSEDWKQSGANVGLGAGYAPERKSLNAILAHREYRGITESTPRERLTEWLVNWADKLLAKLIQFGSHSPWIAFALRALLIVSICVGFAWALIRIERRSRIRLAPEPIAVSGAPSTREWQLWLADAHTMAAQDLWREAIHFLYWAAIARLESRHMWPTDRARTPREYLRLLPAADPRRANLITLTHAFERTWYGGHEAASSDFDAALKLAAALGVE